MGNIGSERFVFDEKGRLAGFACHEAESHKPVMCEIIEGVAIACQRHTLGVVLIRRGADLMSGDEIVDRNSSGRVKLAAACVNSLMRSTRKDRMSWRRWQYAATYQRARQ